MDDMALPPEGYGDSKAPQASAYNRHGQRFRMRGLRVFHKDWMQLASGQGINGKLGDDLSHETSALFNKGK